MDFLHLFDQRDIANCNIGAIRYNQLIAHYASRREDCFLESIPPSSNQARALNRGSALHVGLFVRRKAFHDFCHSALPRTDGQAKVSDDLSALKP